MSDSKSEMNPDQIIELAATWQERANELLTSEEKFNQIRLSKLILHPLDKDFLTKLIDQCFRSKDSVRVADQIIYLLKRSAFPEFFSIWDVILMWLFLSIGRHFPRISVPLMIKKIKKDIGQTIISGGNEVLTNVLRKKREENVRMNLVYLSSMVLGEEEATSRFQKLVEDLKNPDIEYISVKISSIYPQIQNIAYDHILEALVERLSELYRVAQTHYFTYKNGIQVPKFVNLDMEDYEHLDLTVNAFKQTLDKIEFKNHTAGIALQSYLPESFFYQQELTEWAKSRVSSGGNAIKIRLVKGANLEMEKIRSSIHGWPLSTFDNKLDVDANFKRMIDYGLKDGNYKAINLGIASHNIFDLAYSYQLAKENNATDYIVFEMLLGMAGHIQRAIREISGDIVLYSPIAQKHQFINAVSYLIRRLDENTSKENFLRYANELDTTSSNWTYLKDQFLTSCNYNETPGQKSFRVQDRNEKTLPEKNGTYHLGKFINEPATDWSIAANRQWVKKVRQKWLKSPDEKPIHVPIVVSGEEIFEEREEGISYDPSRWEEKVCISRFCFGNEQDVENAIQTAAADQEEWRKNTPNERHAILSVVAQNLRKNRGDLIGAATATTGKIFTEVDKEVSDAIDAVEYYPHSVKNLIEFRNLAVNGKGVGIVITPWNFSIAVSCGGIAAALASGNTVIFKPSSKAVLPSWILCKCFWEAGISKSTLQFLPARGSDIGRRLAVHPNSDFVIFTGTTQSGIDILKTKPDINLTAETGGKNATIITAVSDKEQAIENVIYSAFGNGGQRSSATSLLILEKEVYEDPEFKSLLVDAAKTFKTGSAWDFSSRMGPLIQAPKDDLLLAMTQLEPGESWALKPKNLENNPLLWTPAIKWDVQPGSKTHMTEFFGPVLGVMKADNFDQAVELVNQTGYGLTSGLESLDKRKQEIWKSKIQAGNLYINKSTTGAVTLRQPFGGMGKSVLGPGIKPGGPNYLMQFMDFTETGSPAEIATGYDRKLLRMAKNWIRKTDKAKFKELQTDIQKTVRAMNSYLFHAKQIFRVERDYFHLRGQDNIHRYLPVGNLIIRLHEDDTLFDTLARISAAQIAKCRAVVSIPLDLDSKSITFLEKRERRELISKVKIIRQSDEELIKMMPKIDRIRYAAPDRVPKSVLAAAAEIGFYIARRKVLMEGRLELLHYYRSQSICHNYHRYGNLGTRSFDQSMTLDAPSS